MKIATVAASKRTTRIPSRNFIVCSNLRALQSAVGAS